MVGHSDGKGKKGGRRRGNNEEKGGKRKKRGKRRKIEKKDTYIQTIVVASYHEAGLEKTG